MNRLRGALLGVLASAACATQAHAIAIQFNPVSSHVALGERFGVDVVVAGLDGDPIVSAFDLDVFYDPAILLATSVEFSAILGVPGLDALTDSVLSPGRIDFASVSLLSVPDLLSLQAGEDLVLARLLFNAIGTGRTLLDSGSDALLVGSDPFGSLDLGLSVPGEVTVRDATSLPEGGVLSLCLLALSAGALVRFLSARRAP